MGYMYPLMTPKPCAYNNPTRTTDTTAWAFWLIHSLYNGSYRIRISEILILDRHANILGWYTRYYGVQYDYHEQYACPYDHEALCIPIFLKMGRFAYNDLRREYMGTFSGAPELMFQAHSHVDLGCA